MEITLRKPVSTMLLSLWGTDRIRWEKRLSQWLGFEVTLPKFFWQVVLPANNDRLPGLLTLNCHRTSGWMSVFYEYNFNRDLTRYVEITIVRKCKTIRNNRMKPEDWRKTA